MICYTHSMPFVSVIASLVRVVRAFVRLYIFVFLFMLLLFEFCNLPVCSVVHRWSRQYFLMVNGFMGKKLLVNT